MSGCFLLKDSSGRAGGYLMQSMGEMRVCAGRTPADAQVMVFFEDGSRRLVALAVGQETQAQSDARNVTGAVVFSGGEILLSTGEKARRAFLAAGRKKRKAADGAEIHRAAMSGEKEKLREENDRTTETGRESRLFETDLRSSSERRWPPPPCLNEAYYVRGKWQEDAPHHGSGEERTDRRPEAP